MNQTQMIQENAEKLNKTIGGSGYGMKPGIVLTGHAPEIAQNLLDGKKTFEIAGTANFGRDWMDYVLKFEPNAKNPDGPVYYQGVQADLYKNIKIPIINIEGINLVALEQLLQNPPASKAEAVQAKYITTTSAELKTLMEKSPETFNLLVAKYNPSLNFAVPEPLIKQQLEIHEAHKKSNTFSSYYNLTPLELYGMLNERSANKNLFRTQSAPSKTEEPGVSPDARFNTWLKIDFKKPMEDGSFPVIMIPSKGFNIQNGLAYYNFAEVKDVHGVGEVEAMLRKAAQFKVENLNKTGERHLLIEALPEYKSFRLSKLDGSPISRHSHNNYAKVQVSKEVGEFVEMKKSGPAEKKNEPLNPASQVSRRKLGKTREIAEDTGQGRRQRK